MKTLLLTLISIVALNSYAQNVNIPDANFKAYLVGYTQLNTNGDAEIQVSEATALTYLDCSNLNISNLTGIEAFTALTTLQCRQNQLTSLDVTQNTALTYLDCSDNQLSSLDVTQNTDLTRLYCHDNSLLCLNVKNGNNLNFVELGASNNPSLYCIEVDDIPFPSISWIDIDAQTSFSTNCNNDCSVGINEANLSSLSIYPNPSSTGLIQLNTSIVNSDINVYSIEGKQINFTQSNNVIDISDNEKGVYLISIDGVVIRYVYQD